MAGPPKRRVISNENENQSSSDDDSESYHGQEEIQADFEGRNPEGQDFHGIKQLLSQLFLKAHIDLSEISDLLIAQTGVGSVLKQSSNDEEDDDDDDDDTMTESLDVYGITSVVNLTSHQNSVCVKQLFDLLKNLSEKHCDNPTKAKILNILSSNNKLGLLINERFVNIPPKISDPLLTSLLGELDRIKSKDASYDFDYFIMICKLHKSKGQTDDVLYSNAEEELFERESELNLEFSVQNQSDSSVAGKWNEDDVELTPFRKVLFIKASKLPSIVQQVKVFVN